MYIPIVNCFDAGQAERDVLRLHPRRHRACRSSWRATSIRCAPATTPARGGWSQMMDEFAMDSLDPLADFIFDSIAARHAGRDRATAARHLSRRDRLRRLRGAGHAARGDDASCDDAIEVDFAGTSGLSHARHQRAARRTAAPMPASASRWWWRRRFPTTGPACAVPHDDPRRLHPERAAAVSGLGAPRHRPVAARSDDGLPASGGAATAWRRRAPRACGTRRCAAAARFPARRAATAACCRISRSSPSTPAAPARAATLDGLDATAFPSGVRTMPVEATENVAPVVIWRKELRPD